MMEIALNLNSGLALLCELQMSHEGRLGNCFLSQNSCGGQGINITTEMSHSLHCKLLSFFVSICATMQEKNGDIADKTSLKCQQISNNYCAVQIGVCTSERKLDASDVNLHPFFFWK